MESKQVFNYFAELQASIATLQVFIWRDGPLKPSDYKSNHNIILYIIVQYKSSDGVLKVILKDKNSDEKVFSLRLKHKSSLHLAPKETCII